MKKSIMEEVEALYDEAEMVVSSGDDKLILDHAVKLQKKIELNDSEYSMIQLSMMSIIADELDAV